MEVFINGFGRIGRTFLRNALRREGIRISGINDPAGPEVLAHLLKYDSVHGKADFLISHTQHELICGETRIPFTTFPEIQDLPARTNALLLESSGHYLSLEKLAGVERKFKQVILSAPPKDTQIPVVVFGVNHKENQSHAILSAASCTTHSAASVLETVDTAFGVESAFLSTVHSYTSDQRLVDAPHSDFRRARSAPLSIIPTTTGAAKALGPLFPHLQGKIGGGGIRVPVPDGSLTDLTLVLKKKTNPSELNLCIREASKSKYRGILEYCEEPIVSSDVIGNPHSAVFDSLLTSVVGPMVKLVTWYDNEWGYSNRLLDLIQFLDRREHS